jgi:hypothetical protein
MRRLLPLPLLATLVCLPPAVHGEEKPKDEPRLRFLIVADAAKDDFDAYHAARKALTDPRAQDDLKKRAADGLPPPPIKVEGKSYSWVEMGEPYLRSLKLDNARGKGEGDGRGDEARWKEAAEARAKGEPLPLMSEGVVWSRPCLNGRLTKEERERKRFDYFVLLRDADPKTAVTGKDLESVRPDKTGDVPAVRFTLTKEGGDRLFALTDANKGQRLAVVVDGRVVMAPMIQAAIGTRGQISGGFTPGEIDDIIKALESDLKKK